MLEIIRLILMLIFRCNGYSELLLNITGDMVTQAMYDTVKWGVLLMFGMVLKKHRPTLTDSLRRLKERLFSWMKRLRQEKSSLNLIIIVADTRKAASEKKTSSFVYILLPPIDRQSDLRHRVRYQLIVVLIV